MPSLPNPPLNSPQAERATGKSSIAWASYFTRLTAFINSLTTDFAPSSATYITKTPSTELSAEQSLSSLSTGFMKVATGTGIITSTGNTLIQATDLVNSGAFTGDVSGTFPATVVAKINTATLGSTTATDKNILIADGTQWVTRAVSGDATIGNTGTLTLATSGVTAASYGLHIATYDAKGRATSATTRTITGTSNQINVSNGDGTAGNPTLSISGSYVPALASTVTTNANLTGHVTSVGNAAVLGSFTVAQLSAAISDADISGTNTGDQTNISGNAATVTTNANLTGHVTSTGNAAILGSFTVAQLSTAISDQNISGTNTGDQTITLTGPVTGSGTGSIATTITATPGFSAYASAATTCAAAGFTKVLFATEEFDVGATFASSTFTAPTTGLYHIAAQIQIVGTNVVAGNRYIAILYKNGAQFKNGSETGTVTGSTYTSGISTLLSLAATDTIEMYFYNSNAVLTVDTANAQTQTWFTGHRTGSSS